MKLETDLKKLLADLEEYEKEYANLKHQDDDKICEAIYRGKSEAYSFAVKELRNLLKWHGVIKN